MADTAETFPSHNNQSEQNQPQDTSNTSDTSSETEQPFNDATDQVLSPEEKLTKQRVMKILTEAKTNSQATPKSMEEPEDDATGYASSTQPKSGNILNWSLEDIDAFLAKFKHRATKVLKFPGTVLSRIFGPIIRWIVAK